MQQADFIFSATGLFVVVALLIFLTFRRLRQLGALRNFRGTLSAERRTLRRSCAGSPG